MVNDTGRRQPHSEITFFVWILWNYSFVFSPHLLSRPITKRDPYLRSSHGYVAEICLSLLLLFSKIKIFKCWVTLF